MAGQYRARRVSEIKELIARNFKGLGYQVGFEPNEFPQIKLSRPGGTELGDLVLYGTARFESVPDSYSIGEGLVSRLTLTVVPDKDNPRTLYQYDRGRVSGELKTPEELAIYPVAKRMYDHILEVIRIDLKKQTVRQAVQKPTSQTEYTPASETRVITPKEASENNKDDGTDFELGPA